MEETFLSNRQLIEAILKNSRPGLMKLMKPAERRKFLKDEEALEKVMLNQGLEGNIVQHDKVIDAQITMLGAALRQHFLSVIQNYQQGDNNG